MVERGGRHENFNRSNRLKEFAKKWLIPGFFGVVGGVGTLATLETITDQERPLRPLVRMTDTVKSWDDAPKEEKKEFVSEWQKMPEAEKDKFIKDLLLEKYKTEREDLKEKREDNYEEHKDEIDEFDEKLFANTKKQLAEAEKHGGKLQDFDHGFFHIDAEYGSGNLTEEEHKKAKEKLSKDREKFGGNGNLTLSQLEVVAQNMGRYVPESALLSDIVLRGYGNCEARMKYVLALFPNAEVKIQKYRDHVILLAKVDGVWYQVESEYVGPFVPSEEQKKGKTLLINSDALVAVTINEKPPAHSIEVLKATGSNGIEPYPVQETNSNINWPLIDDGQNDLAYYASGSSVEEVRPNDIEIEKARLDSELRKDEDTKDQVVKKTMEVVFELEPPVLDADKFITKVESEGKLEINKYTLQQLEKLSPEQIASFHSTLAGAEIVISDTSAIQDWSLFRKYFDMPEGGGTYTIVVKDKNFDIARVNEFIGGESDNKSGYYNVLSVIFDGASLENGDFSDKKIEELQAFLDNTDQTNLGGIGFNGCGLSDLSFLDKIKWTKKFGALSIRDNKHEIKNWEALDRLGLSEVVFVNVPGEVRLPKLSLEAKLADGEDSVFRADRGEVAYEIQGTKVSNWELLSDPNAPRTNLTVDDYSIKDLPSGFFAHANIGILDFYHDVDRFTGSLQPFHDCKYIRGLN
ncbi:MAG: hypothetical protein WA057_03755, partial [Candidatus Magasanikiibacteriota bacterium]